MDAHPSAEGAATEAPSPSAEALPADVLVAAIEGLRAYPAPVRLPARALPTAAQLSAAGYGEEGSQTALQAYMRARYQPSVPFAVKLCALPHLTERERRRLRAELSKAGAAVVARGRKVFGQILESAADSSPPEGSVWREHSAVLDDLSSLAAHVSARADDAEAALHFAVSEAISELIGLPGRPGSPDEPAGGVFLPPVEGLDAEYAAALAADQAAAGGAKDSF